MCNANIMKAEMHTSVQRQHNEGGDAHKCATPTYARCLRRPSQLCLPRKSNTIWCFSTLKCSNTMCLRAGLSPDLWIYMVSSPCASEMWPRLHEKACLFLSVFNVLATSAETRFLAVLKNHKFLIVFWASMGAQMIILGKQSTKYFRTS